MAGKPITRAKKAKAAERAAERAANGGKRTVRNPTSAAAKEAKKQEAESDQVEFGGHTQTRWSTFMQEYLKTGRQDKACKASGIPRETVYKRTRQDVEFAKLMEEAREICMGSLEDAAIRRARDGWLEPQFFKGELQGYVRKYSDGLLTFMLMHGKPDKYRPKKEVELSGNAAGVPPTINLTLNRPKKAAE